MGRKISLLLAALLLLGGCYAAQPLEDPSPSAAETSTPTAPPTPTPTPTSEPTQEVKELWGFPIDDTHDAFEVPTGGELGTVLVTVERGEYELDGLYHCTFSVWDANDLTTPIQTFERMGLVRWHTLMDANFDGYMDFCYTDYNAAANEAFCLYCWDEEQGQFVLAKEFWGYGIEVDKENKSLSNYVHITLYAWATETYRWEDGELVCFRIEECEVLNDELQSVERVTSEWIDGQWQEVSRETYAMQGL